MPAAAFSAMTVIVQPRPRASTVSGPMALTPWRPDHAQAAETLIDRAFGPGRLAKTAERVREHATFRPDLSACALFDGALVGAVRMWSVAVGGAPAVFLGPIAVEPAFRHHRLGGELVEHACAAATQAGETAVILVGDRGFFDPLGFSTVPPGRVGPPGPVDPARLFWKALRPGALEAMAGELAGVRQA